MTDPNISMWSAWGKAVGIHLGILGLSFFLSFLLLPLIVPFDPKGAGATAAILGVIIFHAAAAIGSLFFSKTSLISCTVVFCIAFFPAGCGCVEAIQRWRYLHYQAVYDRFRDHVVSPIPESVTNLRFVGLADQIRPELMFRFDVAPEDLDAILTKLKMERVDPKALPNPKDFFQHPYYLPLDGSTFHLYQSQDQYGEMLTIKTNESHTHAIFRKESSRIYSHKDWVNQPDIRIKMDSEALMRLKMEYEAAQKARGSK